MPFQFIERLWDVTYPAHYLLLFVTFIWHALESCSAVHSSVFGQQSKSTLGKKILFTFLKEKANPQMAGFSVKSRTNFAF